MSFTEKAVLGRDSWDVEVEKSGRAWVMVARATAYTLYVLPDAAGGYLIAVPERRRCGLVPPDPSPDDIMRYCDIDNPVDAASISAAARRIIREMPRKKS